MSKPLAPSNFQDPWLYNGKPALVAHRGFARLFPENTLPAMAAAVDAGACFVEFDIQLSKDCVPFLMHDDNFNRTAGIDTSVFDLTMTAIKSIGVGEQQRLGGRYHDVTPITLEHMCEHLNNWQHVHAFIEVKSESIKQFGLTETMQAILSAVAQLEAPFSIISFDDDVIRYTKEHSDYSTAWVISDWDQNNFDRLANLQPEFVFGDFKIIPDKDTLPDGPWAWVLYEIDQPDVALAWRQRGLHLIESMAVSKMLNCQAYTGVDKNDER